MVMPFSSNSGLKCKVSFTFVGSILSHFRSTSGFKQGAIGQLPAINITSEHDAQCILSGLILVKLDWLELLKYIHALFLVSIL